MKNPESAKIFKSLFTGLQRGYGILHDDNHRYVKGQPTTELYQQHLEGKISLGIIPITDKSSCKFGAIDIDDHKKGGIKKDFNYNALLKKIKFLKLPVTVFKSKSGGAHCYLFLDKFYPAIDVRHIMKKFAYALGCSRDIEVYPKQEKLKPSDNGNFINLPYKGGNTRVLLDFEGKELNTSEAMLYASKRVTNESNWSKFKLLDHGKSQDRNNRTFAATAFIKKHYGDWEDQVVEYNKIFNNPPLEEKELFQTVISSNEKKDYFDTELEEAPPTELVGYDISEYRVRTDITKPIFLVEDLIIEGSTNFTFGEKGKGKTELMLGFINALARGQDFLMFGINRPHPCVFIDFEMHPYDVISRNAPYLEKYGSDPKKDYLHILNWNDQKNRNFPDIAGEEGQELILKYLQKIESITGKKPFCVLDNLRSASGYKENDADSWRPIGLWLKHMTHGLNYTLDVVDHSGKSVELEMRGTSSKADWANVCLQILPEKRQGGLMRIKVKYAKARGLRPDQTDSFVCQYDLAGNWTLGASDKETADEELKEELKKLIPKNWSQRAMAKELDISSGKVNQLIKEIEKGDK
jgi:KaiC/GvpD/RAD55 family RecA-like ATPase